MNFSQELPLSLYIHTPWCVRKCPYCDFNSHALKQNLPEDLYIAALLRDFLQDQTFANQRSLKSIFIGGGTPSLFSPRSFAKLLTEINQHINFEKDIEITLEANPGTVEQSRFEGYRAAGINRISLGIQSFDDKKLKSLGRIHGGQEAKSAISAVKKAGFQNFNIDLMFGLPEQNLQEGLLDLQTGINFEPPHLSWYQLTLEPNTLFYRSPPNLPNDEMTWDLQFAGQELLRNAQFGHYEVSAYSKVNRQCRHNLNYWEFGDYLGIGAGAHGKITNIQQQKVLRTSKSKHPKDYLKDSSAEIKIVDDKEIIFEFMLNALRLKRPIAKDLFLVHTGLLPDVLQEVFQKAMAKKLLTVTPTHFYPTELGYNFLNDLLALFST